MFVFINKLLEILLVSSKFWSTTSDAVSFKIIPMRWQLVSFPVMRGIRIQIERQIVVDWTNGPST